MADLRCNPTLHAMERAQQRLGIPSQRARRELRRLYHHSVKLPMRYARRLLNMRDLSSRVRARARKAVDYRAAGSALLVCKKHHVLTVLDLNDDQSATVLVWVATGIWPETK